MPHKKKKENMFEYSGVAFYTTQRKKMKKEPKQESWEEEWGRRFGKLVLGTLSGDEKSPVFVNNELEVPRLLNFIRSTIEAEREGFVKELNNLLDRNDQGYNEETSPIKMVQELRDKYAQSHGIKLE